MRRNASSLVQCALACAFLPAAVAAGQSQPYAAHGAATSERFRQFQKVMESQP